MRAPFNSSYGLVFGGSFLLIMLFGFFLNNVESRRLLQEEREIVDRVLNEAVGALQSRIYENIHRVSVVKPLVALNPDLTQEEFSLAMSLQFSGREELRNIGLAREMVMRFLYPIEGNEAAIGLDYRTLPDQLPAVELALEQNQTVLAGPIALVQGGQGLAARIPIHLPDPESDTEVFWGFASVVIHVDGLMEQAGFAPQTPLVNMAVRGRDAQGAAGEIFFGDPAVFDQNPLTALIHLPYGSWQVGAVPPGGWRTGPAGWTPIMSLFAMGAALLLLSLGLIAVLLGRQKKYWQDLERERNIFATGPVWHMEWDPEPDWHLRLRYVSSNVEPILGYPLEEWREGKLSYLSILHPGDRDRVQERLAALIESGVASYEDSYRVFSKAGDVISIYDHTMLVRDKQGRLTSIRSYMYDETARVEAEAALRAAEEKLQKTAYELTENIPVGTYTMLQPPEGGLAKFCFMSSRFLELTGLTREAAERDPLEAFACVHPEDYDEWVALNAEAFATQSAFFGETRIQADGEIRWITAESKPRRLPDGSVLWEGVLTDITPMKQTQQALQESVDRFNDLVSYVSVGVYVLWIRADGSMDCEYVSDGWCSMTGLAREAVMRDWGVALRVIHPEEREAFIALHHEVYQHRKPFVWEGRVLVNGVITYARIQSNPVFFENGDSRWFGVHQDITPQREMAQELLEAKNRAEAASVAKGLFLPR